MTNSHSTLDNCSTPSCSEVLRSTRDLVSCSPIQRSSQDKENQSELQTNKRKSLNELDNTGKRSMVEKVLIKTTTAKKTSGKKTLKAKQPPPLIKGQSKLGAYFNK